MTPTVYKYLSAILIFAGIVYGIHHDGYTEGMKFTQDAWNAQKAADSDERTKAIEANAALTTQLEKTKNESQTRIDNLARINAATRVRLPASTVCNSQASSPSGSQPAVAAGELLPTAPTSPQEALDRFMAGVDEDVAYMDKIVASCKVTDDWAVGVGK